MIRYVRFGLLFFAALLLVGSAAAYFWFDPNVYKGRIEELVQNKTGHRLRIEGNISLRLFPSAGLDLGKIDLEQAGSNVPLLSLSHARVTFAVLPLLRGQLQAGEIRVDGLQLGIVQYRDGRLNVRDLMQGGGTPFFFDIGKVVLRDAEISYRDELAGTTTFYPGLSMETGRLQNGLPWKFAILFSQNKGVKLSGRMEAFLLVQNVGFSIEKATGVVDAEKPGEQLEAQFNVPKMRFAQKWQGEPAALDFSYKTEQTQAKLALQLSGWQKDGSRISGSMQGKLSGEAGKLPFSGDFSANFLDNGGPWNLDAVVVKFLAGNLPIEAQGEISGENRQFKSDFFGRADSAVYRLLADNAGNSLHFNGNIAAIDLDRWRRQSDLLPKGNAADKWSQYRVEGKMKVAKMHYSGVDFSGVTLKVTP